MSENLNNAKNGAIRLFEAMSGVDEKYLAACEDYKKTKPKGVIVFMQKYGKGMAAVLCLAVLGVGYVSMQQATSMDTAASVTETAMNSMTASQECAEAPMAEADMAENFREDVVTDGGLQNGEASGSSYSDMKEVGVEAEAAKPELELQAGSVPAEDSVNRAESKEGFSDAEVELTLEEAKALAVIGEYVPDSWPEDGVLVEISGVQESGAEYVKVLWANNNMQDAFVVKVENLGKKLPEWVQDGIRQDCIIQMGEFSKEFIVLNSENAAENDNNVDVVEVDFGVLHNNGANYVLVRFKGISPVEQIWELLQ